MIPDTTALREQLTRVTTRRADAVRRAATASAEVSRLEREEDESSLAGALIRTLIDSEVNEGVRAVEELLTEGLHAVFEDQDLSVRAEVSVAHGKVSVEFVTVQKQADGSVTEGLSRDAYGGAVTTVQSVLLRVIVTLRRGMRPVLFMDETLPAFDANYVNNMGNFLRTLCTRLGYDMLLVSHNPAMVDAATHAYRIVKVDGRATFRQLR